MFEILKIFIEQAFKLLNVDALVQSRKKEQLATIGINLFSLYASLNEIYTTGLLIVRDIEQTIARWHRYRDEGRPQEPIRSYDLTRLLQQQARNITSFGNSFVKLAPEMGIIDPESTRSVALFLSTKINIINVIIGNIGGGSYVSEYETFMLSASLEQRLIAAVGQAKVEDFDLHYDMNNRMLKDVKANVPDSLDIRHLNAEDIKYLEDYLAQKDPLRHLEALKVILERLYEKIVSNFDIKDILIRVGQTASQNRLDTWIEQFDAWRSHVTANRR